MFPQAPPELPPAPGDPTLTHPPPRVAPPEEGGIDLRQHWHTLRNRWLPISLTTLVVFVAVLVGSFLMRPVYRSISTIQIERENPNILTFQEVQLIDARQDDFYQTHLILLQSRSLLSRVIAEMRLAENPEFTALLRDTPEGAARDARMVDLLQSRLIIQPVRRSRLFRVIVDTGSPKLSAAIANAVTAAYIEMGLEAKFEATEAATEFLSKQIEGLTREIEEKKGALQEYAQQAKILSLDEGQNITVQRLSDLNAALTRAQTERMEAESRYRALVGLVGTEGSNRDLSAGFGYVPDIANNQLVQTLRGSLAQLQSRYMELSQRFRPDWPEMVRLREQLDELRRQVSAEEGRIVRGLVGRAEADYKASLGREQLLSQQLDRQKSNVTDFNRSSILYNTLKAEIDNKLSLLDSLLKRKNETDVAARLKGLKSSNVRTVDPAEPPTVAWRPNKKANAFFGLVLGMVLGIAVAFFLEFIDNTIKSVEDIERYTGLTSFGVIPLFASTDPSRALTSGESEADAGASQLVTLRDGRSAVSEAYRALRTSLLLSTAGRAPRTLLVTSSQPGEGKTTTVVNTAIALAQAGKQVLLVDADLRKPRCHRLLGLHNKLGLSTFLAGTSELKQLVQVTSVRNLFVLTSGPIPPNPAELLGSGRMADLLRSVPPGINHILFDSPPVLSVTDATLLATLVEGVMIVVRSGKTPRQLLKRTQRRILDVHARIVGVVLNSVDERTGDYYSYSYKGYGYGDEKQSA